MTLSLDDRLELHELPGRYGDAIDDRAWDQLHRIFTDHAVFDLTGVRGPRLDGLEAIRRFMDEEARHPEAHLMTNTYVDESPGGAYLYFRIAALQRDGRVRTASYYDDVVRTPQGWRVQHRDVVLGRR